MKLKVFSSGPVETNTYLLSCPHTKQAVIIDAPPESLSWILSEVQRDHLTVIALLLTHSHWDHIADALAIKNAFHIPLYVHKEDAGNVEHPGSDRLPLVFPLSPCPVDHYVKEGDVVSVGNLQLEVIHTPGHTPGCVCFYLKKEHALFSGDTLFQGTIGRINFPSSRPKLMWSSLKKLAALPPNTIVYPGHGDPTTIGDEDWLDHPQEKFGNPIDE